MPIHRRFLYAGLFLVAVGGVLVAANLTGVNEPFLREALRLWPLVILAIGLAIVVRRSRYAVPAGVLAAIGPGLLIGGGMVAAPRMTFDCSDAAQPARAFQQDGVLADGASVSLSTGCGTATITTAAGSTWALSAGSTDGREPDVIAEPTSLSIDSPGRGGRQLLLGDRREDWDVTLPTTMAELAVAAHANTTTIALPGADIAILNIEADASTVRLDATGATLLELYAEVNFGSASITLPGTSRLVGNLTVDVGAIRLCVPVGVEATLKFLGDGPRDVSVAGEPWTADQWTSSSAGRDLHQIDLDVEATFSSVDINPIGGCS